jgi:hypothetical protein
VLAHDISGLQRIASLPGLLISSEGLSNGCELFLLGKFEEVVVDKTFVNEQQVVVPAGRSMTLVEPPPPLSAAVLPPQQQQQQQQLQALTASRTIAAATTAIASSISDKVDNNNNDDDEIRPADKSHSLQLLSDSQPSDEVGVLFVCLFVCLFV